MDSGKGKMRSRPGPPSEARLTDTSRPDKVRGATGRGARLALLMCARPCWGHEHERQRGQERRRRHYPPCAGEARRLQRRGGAEVCAAGHVELAKQPPEGGSGGGGSGGGSP